MIPRESSLSQKGSIKAKRIVGNIWKPIIYKTYFSFTMVRMDGCVDSLFSIRYIV